MIKLVISTAFITLCFAATICTSASDAGCPSGESCEKEGRKMAYLCGTYNKNVGDSCSDDYECKVPSYPHYGSCENSICKITPSIGATCWLTYWLNCDEDAYCDTANVCRAQKAKGETCEGTSNECIGFCDTETYKCDDSGDLINDITSDDFSTPGDDAVAAGVALMLIIPIVIPVIVVCCCICVCFSYCQNQKKANAIQPTG